MQSRERKLDFNAGSYYANSYNPGLCFYVKKSVKQTDGSYSIEGEWFSTTSGAKVKLNIDQVVIVPKDQVKHWSKC